MCQQYEDGINSIKFKQSGLETGKDNFKVTKMHLQKMIFKRKKSYLEEEQDNSRKKPKEFWKTLKSLSLSWDKARQSNISLKKDGAIQLEALENTNTFKRFYYQLAGGLQGKLPKAPNKFIVNQPKTTIYAKTSCNVSNEFEFSNVSEEKILLSLDTSKAVGMDQNPAKFLRHGAEVLALPLRNINLSIKLSTFQKECKIDKLKSTFKKVARSQIPKTTNPFHFCH